MPEVLVVIGSKSDLPIAEKAVDIFKKFNIKYNLAIASAHRTPKRVIDLISESDAKIIIAIAGLSAALPGVIASYTTRPVIGVPVSGKINMDAILSIVQMPSGIPVASVGLDRGDNAAILAAEILSIEKPEIAKKLNIYREELATKIKKDAEEIVRYVKE